jgi:hypothetical protein
VCLHTGTISLFYLYVKATVLTSTHNSKLPQT